MYTVGDHIRATCKIYNLTLNIRIKAREKQINKGLIILS